VREQALIRFDAGLDAAAAADDIDISQYAGWTDPERIAANVVAAYREFDPSSPAPTQPELFMAMAAWLARY
jgi:cyclase